MRALWTVICLLSLSTQMFASEPEVWACADAEGEAFDLVLWPDGTVVTTWVKGPLGARGERGFWHRGGGRVLALLEDGWSDVISPTRDGSFEHAGRGPGASLHDPPSNQSPARMLEGLDRKLVGVWVFTSGSRIESRYVCFRSDRRLFSSDGNTGSWIPLTNAARCEWKDGSIEVIRWQGTTASLQSWEAGVPTRKVAPTVSTPFRVGADGVQVIP